jgi:DNA repair protein RadD
VPDVPDLSSVSVVGGDFVIDELEKVMTPRKLVANIVDTWLQLAADRPTVCFCCTRAHADQVAKEFTLRGVGAAYLDCETSMADRAEVRRRMLRGEVKVVTNVEIVGLGIDWPEVSCISYCRPTMSDMRFVQNVGRGLRRAEGKVDLLILDHSTTTMRLGFINEIYAMHRALDDGKTKPTQPVAVLLPKPCEACSYLKPPRTAKCPNCGHVMEKHANHIAVQRGTLREIKADVERNNLIRSLPDKAHVYGQLVWWGQKKGYKPYWANMKFAEIYGVKFPRNLAWEDKVDSPVPLLLDHIYRSIERWKRKQYNGKRKAVAKPQTGVVSRSLMTKDDWEDFK